MYYGPIRHELPTQIIYINITAVTTLNYAYCTWHVHRHTVFPQGCSWKRLCHPICDVGGTVLTAAKHFLDNLDSTSGIPHLDSHAFYHAKYNRCAGSLNSQKRQANLPTVNDDAAQQTQYLSCIHGTIDMATCMARHMFQSSSSSEEGKVGPDPSCNPMDQKRWKLI